MLNLFGFTSAVQAFAAGAQAAATAALDFTVGSILRALAEAQATVALWVQWDILRAFALTRLATSTGSDVDSWVADWGLTRLPGVAATGSASFSRYSATQPALLVPGALIRSADGTVTATVLADPTNTLWSTTAGSSAGFYLPANTSSVTVPVIANTAGSVGNVAAATLTVLASAIPGVDTVTNLAPLSGGLDEETDAALQARWTLFVSSLARATDTALLSAVASVQQGLAAEVVDGAVGSGTSTVYVDDGTGSPPSALIASIALAVQAVRPAGVTVYVQPPTLIPVSINVAMIEAPGVTSTAAVANVVSAVSAAVTAYVTSLGMAQSLSYAQAVQAALNAAPPGSDIASLTLNGGISTIAAPAGHRIHLASITVA